MLKYMDSSTHYLGLPGLQESTTFLGSLSILNEGYEEFYYNGKEYNNFLNKKSSLVSNHCLALGGNSAIFSCHFRKHGKNKIKFILPFISGKFPINNRFVFIMCVME